MWRLFSALFVVLIAVGCGATGQPPTTRPKSGVVAAAVKSKPVAAKMKTATTRRVVLVVIDKTMQGRIDTALQDWRIAASASGWTSEILWADRVEPKAPGWRESVVALGREIRTKQFDSLFIIGGVVQPLSGSMSSNFNGGHFNGATAADAFYAATQIPIEAWTSRDVLTVSQGPWPHNANNPDDGVFDVDYYVGGFWESADLKTKASLSTDKTLRPKPFSRVDASRLGVFGISINYTPTASDAEVAVITAYLKRATKWRLGRHERQPSRVIWDNALLFTDAYPYGLRAAWGRYGAIDIVNSVGDNSGTATGWQQYNPGPATAALAYTGGGVYGGGTYLNFGPWNNSPTRRTLSPDRFESVKYKVNVWGMWGSYIHDISAPGSLVRAALLQPDGECVFSTPGWVRQAEGPEVDRTFGDSVVKLLDSLAANSANSLNAYFPGVGDPTLPTLPPDVAVGVTDLTMDGVTNFDDLLIMASRYNSTGSLSQGDLNFDGKIDFDDLLILSASYNK